MELLGAYEAHSILGPRFRNDVLRIAVATVAEVDVAVSWGRAMEQKTDIHAVERVPM